MFFPEMGTGFMGSNANQARIGNIFILIISQAGGDSQDDIYMEIKESKYKIVLFYVFFS